jgi:hypothetical protein
MAQAEHDAEAVNEYVPGAQATQLVDPAALWYIPIEHNVHAAAPVEPEYWPGAQLAQTADTAPPKTAEDDPVEHEAHAADPVAAANVPAAQSEHADAPAWEYDPAAQMPVHMGVDKPEVPPYWPAEQSEHV